MSFCSPQLAIIKWLGHTDNASEHGVLIDNMLNFVHYFMLFLFVGWGLYLVYTLWRFRASKHPKADYYGARTHLSTHLEIGVIVVEVGLLLAFAWPLWAARVNYRDQPSAAEDPVEVRVIGVQFYWLYHYPGKDKTFGNVRENLADGSNLIGLNMDDPAAQDDFTVQSEMVIPTHRPVILYITAKDVIHNFALHNFRVAQDAIPGLEIPTWFTAIEEGDYEAVCGQLCGYGHYAMRGFVKATSEEEFNKWLDGKHVTTPAGMQEAKEAEAAESTAAAALEAVEKKDGVTAEI